VASLLGYNHGCRHQKGAQAAAHGLILSSYNHLKILACPRLKLVLKARTHSNHFGLAAPAVEYHEKSKCNFKCNSHSSPYIKEPQG
jgi:hypothetical protein